MTGEKLRSSELYILPFGVHSLPHYLFVFINLFILFMFFLAALGLCCCVQAFSSFGKQGLLFIAVRGLLIAVASLVAEPGL